MPCPSTRTLLLGALLAMSSPIMAGTLFVDAGLGAGLNDGSSWANAFQGPAGLQTALAAALPGDQVFVAQGTYLPSQTGSRSEAFALRNDVTLYGSFLGGESGPEQRPPFGTADSVLSGDLAGNDGAGLFGDNSYHLITTVGTNASAVIDGFVVSGGAATAAGGNRDRGAGILCLDNVSPTVRHCRFRDHRSNFGGASGYINNGAAPSFTDCSFENGLGGSFGGAFDIANGGPVLFERCRFFGNSAARAGALEVFATTGVLVDNCIFRDNVATGSGGGGAIWMGQGGNTRLRGCTIVSNDSLVNKVGGLRNQGAGGASVANCIFWANTGPGGTQNPANQVNAATLVDHSIVQGGFGGTGVGNLADDPRFADLPGGDFSLLGDSPAIDAGDNSVVPADTTLDFDGQPRFADSLAVADTGIGPAPVVDMGALEFPSAWLDLGSALPGSAGAPALILSGTLTPASPLDLSLSNAAGGANAWLVLGLSLLAAPFKGGVLVPDADLILPASTTAGGTLALSTSWPLGIPAGVPSYYQVWVQDTAGPAGFTASNGVQGVTP